MKTDSLEGTSHIFRGVVDRITFRNPENHFTIAKVRDEENNDLVTVLGSLVGIEVGETVRIEGTWTIDPKWGRQVRATSFHPITPTTIQGIERFLGSGLIEGVGPELAKRIVAKFGTHPIQ